MRGEIAVALDGRAVLVSGDRGVPAAVAILVAGQPVEGALHGQLAGRAGAGEPGAGGPVGLDAGSVDPGDLGRRPHGRPLAERGQPGPARRRRPGRGRHVLQRERSDARRIRSSGRRRGVRRPAAGHRAASGDAAVAGSRLRVAGADGGRDRPIAARLRSGPIGPAGVGRPCGGPGPGHRRRVRSRRCRRRFDGRVPAGGRGGSRGRHPIHLGRVGGSRGRRQPAASAAGRRVGLGPGAGRRGLGAGRTGRGVAAAIATGGPGSGPGPIAVAWPRRSADGRPGAAGSASVGADAASSSRGPSDETFAPSARPARRRRRPPDSTSGATRIRRMCSRSVGSESPPRTTLRTAGTVLP